MNRINLQKLMEVHNLSRDKVAEAIFPMNRYSKSALARVLRGEGVLDENQIYRLSIMLDIPVSGLFDEGWKTIPSGDCNLIVMRKENIRIELRTDTFITKVYDTETLKTEIVIASKAVTLTEYLNLLNKLV